MAWHERLLADLDRLSVRALADDQDYGLVFSLDGSVRNWSPWYWKPQVRFW